MNRISRRTLLRGAGGAAIALPFLDIMGSARTASAAAAPGYTDAGYPKRFVVMFSPNGTIPDAWKPSGSESDWQLSRILKPLERYKEKVIVVQGVDQQGGGGDGHQNGMGGMLTGNVLNPGPFEGGDGSTAGWANGESVDQRIARVIGNETKFRSLEFAVQAGRNGDNWNRMCYLGPDQPIPPEQDPYAAYDRIFKDVAVPPNVAALATERQKAVLGAVMDDYRTLNQKLGSDDRKKLEAHLGAISDIESRIGLTAKAATDSCKPLRPNGTLDPSANANFPEVGKLLSELLVMSLACDLTRVASLQWNRSVGGAKFTWLDPAIERGHHDMSHDGDTNAETVENLTRINVWYAEQFAALIGALDAIPEGATGGTMLDNTVVLWCNELGKGNSHTRRDAPYVLAGGAGGYLKTNRYLQYGDTPHNNLLVTLINAMGIETNSFGNADWCTGPLAGLA